MLESLDPGTISAGQVLRLVRNGEANTRTELARLAGLSRSTLAERVQTLLALELLDEVTGVESTGGRPPATLAFNSSAGVVLVADLDGSDCRAAVSDLDGTPLAEETFAFDRSLKAYEPLYDRARAIAGRARNPYAATVAT